MILLVSSYCFSMQEKARQNYQQWLHFLSIEICMYTIIKEQRFCGIMQRFWLAITMLMRNRYLFESISKILDT